jgi:D-glycero-D-manno-heptose 1,7-bisphosphate phosphatase
VVRPAIFLDRDGVLTRSEIRGGRPYAPRRLEDFEILADAPAALSALAAAGFALVVVTNQPDVGNGLVERGVVEQMHARLAAALPLDAIKACWHRQDEGCGCRKPAPGMLLEAAAELGLDLAASVMIGDRWSDVAAGRAAGCRTVFIDRFYGERRPDSPDLIVGSLGEAARSILGAGP